MSSDPWAEKPEALPVGWAETLYYSKPDMDAFHEKLKGKITQLHECLGEYESKEWCGHCIADAKCAQITMHIIELKKKGDVLDFLFGEKGVRTENLMKIQIWREKAELWDESWVRSFPSSARDQVLRRMMDAEQKLEAVRNWWNLFNQCIDSEAVKDKLWEILETRVNHLDSMEDK
ncbi:MAG: hypothetical protein KAT53_10140 [Dehalococcoidia bacterium]|nr:hypothetical protein [Dehalococcoidia bacterium]